MSCHAPPLRASLALARRAGRHGRVRPRAAFEDDVLRKGDLRVRGRSRARPAGGASQSKAPTSRSATTSASGSTLFDVRCGQRDDDAPLSALTGHLIMGTTEREFETEEVVPFDRREALHTVLRAKLDGVPMQYDIYVMKKDGCVFDLVYVAPPDRFAAGRRGLRAVRPRCSLSAGTARRRYQRGALETTMTPEPPDPTPSQPGGRMSFLPPPVREELACFEACDEEHPPVHRGDGLHRRAHVERAALDPEAPARDRLHGLPDRVSRRPIARHRRRHVDLHRHGHDGAVRLRPAALRRHRVHPPRRRPLLLARARPDADGRHRRAAASAAAWRPRSAR